MHEDTAEAVLDLDDEKSVGLSGKVEVTPSETAEQRAVAGMWLTPGSYLFREVADRPEILAIVERVEPKRHCVTVALGSDPDDLLDLIFETERQMMATFERLPFDLRVTVPQGEDALQTILESGTVQYQQK